MIMPAPYHLLFVFLVISALLGCLATPLTRRWKEMAVKHAWDAVPENWESRDHPPADTEIDLYLALKSHNESALIDALYEVSEPSHPKYGAHLSKEQVAEIVAPHSDTFKLVNSWLEDHGVPSTSVSTVLGGNWLAVIGVPVSLANDILGASYQLYQHVETNDTVLRTVSYSLPKVLHEHILTVAPTTYFGSPRTERKKRPIHSSGVAAVRTEAGSGEVVTASQSRELALVTPSYLRWLYKTMGYVPAAAGQNAFGTAGFNDEFPNSQDLKDFMEQFRTDGEDATFTVVKTNGGRYEETEPGIEASLNLQLAEAMTYPTPNIYYSIGGRMFTVTDPYINWLRYLLVQPQANIPKTISTTYAGFEYNFPQAHAEAVCELFAKLGAYGISILFASGDDGVGKEKCLFRDNSGNVGVRFLALFPASCPWVTTVGGTTSDSPEIAADLSGGGFSKYFPRPYYQAKAVPTFLNNLGETHKGLYNPDGRGYPDLAAQALKYVINWDGKWVGRDGTSCSTPVVAGIISLLNDYLLSKGQPPLGFLNPWLYGKGLAGLNDIISGSNPGCETDGFSAIVGWDPVTGLGSLDFDKLEEIIDDRLWGLRGPKAIN